MTFEEKFTKAYTFIKTIMQEEPSLDEILRYLYTERDITGK